MMFIFKLYSVRGYRTPEKTYCSRSLKKGADSGHEVALGDAFREIASSTDGQRWKCVAHKHFIVSGITPPCLISPGGKAVRSTDNISNFHFTLRYLHRQSQYSNAWHSKCLALIAQMVRIFGMNPKVGASSPQQVETFTVSNTLTPSQEHPFVGRKWILLPAHS